MSCRACISSVISANCFGLLVDTMNIMKCVPNSIDREVLSEAPIINDVPIEVNDEDIIMDDNNDQDYHTIQDSIDQNNQMHSNATIASFDDFIEYDYGHEQLQVTVTNDDDDDDVNNEMDDNYTDNDSAESDHDSDEDEAPMDHIDPMLQEPANEETLKYIDPWDKEAPLQTDVPIIETVYPAAQLLKHEKMSYELYCWIQQFNISREAYVALLLMLNKWIMSDEFDPIPLFSPAKSEAHLEHMFDIKETKQLATFVADDDVRESIIQKVNYEAKPRTLTDVFDGSVYQTLKPTLF
ncbi:hypothetical protein BDA99DRAFT_542685 [Phascolomyces articulosus]|uniref:Uncharacterized protein n=1 Tax=Phascolomyces articulosus TaxID=60185 RepID=A0AAD5JNW3_9FUNG|nr:hypothetical protein BDA99DRAFT_542685 [Phascolomyces articulosus]